MTGQTRDVRSLTGRALRPASGCALALVLSLPALEGPYAAAVTLAVLGAALLALNASLARRGRALPRALVPAAEVACAASALAVLAPALGASLPRLGWAPRLVLACSGAVLAHAALEEGLRAGARPAAPGAEGAGWLCARLACAAAPLALLGMSLVRMRVLATDALWGQVLAPPSLMLALASTCAAAVVRVAPWRFGGPRAWALAAAAALAPAAAAALSALGLDASVAGAVVALAALASVAGRLRPAAPEDAGLALALAALLLAMLVSPASVLVVPLSLGEGPSSLLVGLCALTLAAEGLLARRAGPAASEADPLPAGLSPREREVAQGLLAGATVRRLAEDLGISRGTVGTYCSRVYEKAGVASREEFVARFSAGAGRGQGAPGPRLATGPAWRALVPMAAATALLAIAVGPWAGWSSLVRGFAEAPLAEGAFAELGALAALGWALASPRATSRAALAAASISAAALSVAALAPTGGCPFLLTDLWAGQMAAGACAALGVLRATCAASAAWQVLWAPVASAAALALAPAGWEGGLAVALAGCALLAAPAPGRASEPGATDRAADMGHVPAPLDAALLACGGVGAGVVSGEVAGLRVEWALLGGAGSGELLGWLVAGTCAAALVSVAVALAAPRGRRASTLAPTAALLALSWAPVALGAPPSAWGAGRAALASLLPTALVTGASALAVRLGERGASRPRALLALGAPVLVGSAIVRSGSAPALSVPPVAAVALAAAGAAGLWRASRALSRRARAAQGGRLALVERGLCARGLTRAEARVAALLACGLGASAVASRLSVSTHTVAAQRRSAYRKLGVHAQAELAALAEEILLELL